MPYMFISRCGLRERGVWELYVFATDVAAVVELPQTPEDDPLKR